MNQEDLNSNISNDPLNTSFDDLNDDETMNFISHSKGKSLPNNLSRKDKSNYKTGYSKLNRIESRNETLETETETELHSHYDNEFGVEFPAMKRDIPYLEEDFFQLVIRRSIVLLILLVIHSASSIVFDYFEKLLKKNYIVVLYLTMITGSGGNAGSQTVVFIVKELATGNIHFGNIMQLWKRELQVSGLIVLIVGFVGFLRVFFGELIKVLVGSLFGWEETTFSIISILNIFRNTFAVVLSLCAVMITSVTIGMILPILFKALNIDPAHASPSIQVIMDLTGILITCIVAAIVLP